MDTMIYHLGFASDRALLLKTNKIGDFLRRKNG